MKKYQVTWGWQPPQFEKLNNGNIRVFYHTKQFKETVKYLDPETEESVEEEITRWLCDVVEVSDSQFTTMIRENSDSLECQKRILRERIMAYDSSEYVNSFSIGGISTWLDKATRVGLKLRFEAEKRMGKTETTLWKNGMQFPLPLTGDVTALDMLDGIELYASTCYDNTQRHLTNIGALSTVEEILTYDYTLGYPEKLRFEL